MVRAIASEENKKIGLDFALAVTAETEPGEDHFITRSGEAHTLFSALKQCCPSVVRNEDPFVGRHGMTELEFNKVLERNGFVKIRDRSSAEVQPVPVESVKGPKSPKGSLSDILLPLVDPRAGAPCTLGAAPICHGTHTHGSAGHTGPAPTQNA